MTAITLRADVCPVQTVVVCSCGARVADGRTHVAWSLAARHAMLHGRDGAQAVESAKAYARYHRRKSPAAQGRGSRKG